MEIKIDASAKDGSRSWVVISWGVERYVTELSLDCTDTMHVDADTLSTGKPVAFLPWKGQQGASSSSQKEEAHTPKHQRKWEYIPSADKVMDTCRLVSKRMEGILRHAPIFRVQDAAFSWEKLITYIEKFRGQIANWSTEQWIGCLKKGTDKI